jgi:hypothetical protein
MGKPVSASASYSPVAARLFSIREIATAMAMQIVVGAEKIKVAGFTFTRRSPNAVEEDSKGDLM